MKFILIILCFASFISQESWARRRILPRPFRSSQPTPPEPNNWYHDIDGGLYAGRDGNMYLADSGRYIPLVLEAGGKVIPDPRYAHMVRTPAETVNQKAQAYYKTLRDTNESLWGRVAQKLERTEEGRAILSQYQKPAASGPELVEAPQPGNSNTHDLGGGSGSEKPGGNGPHDGGEKTAKERPTDDTPKPGELEMLEKRFAKLKPLSVEETKTLMKEGKLLAEGECTVKGMGKRKAQFGLLENQINEYGRPQPGITGGIVNAQPDYTAARNVIANSGKVSGGVETKDITVNTFDFPHAVRREENKLISCSVPQLVYPSCCEFDLTKQVAMNENPVVKKESEEVAKHFNEAVPPKPRSALALTSRRVASKAPFRCHLESDPTRVLEKTFDISRLAWKPSELNTNPAKEDNFIVMKDGPSAISGSEKSSMGKRSYTENYQVMGQKDTSPQNLLIGWEVVEKIGEKSTQTKWLCEGRFLPKTNPPIESMAKSDAPFRVEGEVVKADGNVVAIKTPDGRKITLNADSPLSAGGRSSGELDGYLPDSANQPSVDPRFIRRTKPQVGDKVNVSASFYQGKGPDIDFDGHYLIEPNTERTTKYNEIREKVKKALAELETSISEPTKFRKLYSQFLQRQDLIDADPIAARTLADRLPVGERPYLGIEGAWSHKTLNDSGEKGDYLAMTQKELFDYVRKSIEDADKESDFQNFDYRLGLLRKGTPDLKEERKQLLKMLIDKAKARIAQAEASDTDQKTFSFRYSGEAALGYYDEFAAEDFDYFLEQVKSGSFDADGKLEDALWAMSPADRMKHLPKIKSYIDSQRDSSGRLRYGALQKIEALLAQTALEETAKAK